MDPKKSHDPGFEQGYICALAQALNLGCYDGTVEEILGCLGNNINWDAIDNYDKELLEKGGVNWRNYDN